MATEGMRPVEMKKSVAHVMTCLKFRRERNKIKRNTKKLGDNFKFCEIFRKINERQSYEIFI